MFVEVVGQKLVRERWGFLPPSPSLSILNRVKTQFSVAN